MKLEREIFQFKAGKYVVGDVSKLFEEKDAAKMKASFSKLKTPGGYNKRFDCYYFKPESSGSNTFMDYIERDVELVAETCLIVIPAERAKSGKLKNCRRFNAKKDFHLTYQRDDMGAVLTFQDVNGSWPFMMLVQLDM